MRREVDAHEQIDVPFRFGRDILRDDPGLLISGEDPGEALGSGVGLQARVGPLNLVRPVAVSFGVFRESRQSDGLCYRDLSWKAVRGKVLFPVMEGELELSELSSNRVQLSLIGCYRPPFSVLGAAIDAVALHRVAEDSLKALVRDAASALKDAWSEKRRSMAGSGTAR